MISTSIEPTQLQAEGLNWALDSSFRFPDVPRVSSGASLGWRTSFPSYLNVDGIVDFGRLAEDINPLAQIGKLPHVAYALQKGLLVISNISAYLVDGSFAGRHGVAIV